jgi:serine/threonine protein phosphatase PrpC
VLIFGEEERFEVRAVEENIYFCARTDIGLERARNEDAHVVISKKLNPFGIEDDGAFFSVADGMSGHAGGDTASRMAVDLLRRHYAEELRDKAPCSAASPQPALSRLEKCFPHINQKISEAADATRKYEYMGTTLSVLSPSDGNALIGHVGDSRIYRLRNNCLEQLTEDDTMAQLSVEMGYLSVQEAVDHPLNYALTQALGQGVDEVHTREEDVKCGDIFLLSTDGLHHMISDEEIKEILQSGPVDWEPCRRLVDSALEKGGKDNVTVIVVQVS